MAQRSLPPGAAGARGGSGTRLKGGAPPEPPPEPNAPPLRDRGGSGSSHELHSGPVAGSGSSLCAATEGGREGGRGRARNAT
jgi:hypothetical protein